MAIARLGRQAKRSYGFCIKLTAVVILGLGFIAVWSVFSPSSSVISQRSTFGEIVEPGSANGKVSKSSDNPIKSEPGGGVNEGRKKKANFESGFGKEGKQKVNGSVPLVSVNRHKNEKEAAGKKRGGENIKLPKEVEKEKNQGEEGSGVEDLETEKEKEEGESKEEEEIIDNDLITVDVDVDEEDESRSVKGKRNKKKAMGPVFYPKAQYNWKLCSTRSKYNYIPCIDTEGGFGRFQSYRHHERSCPKLPLMCLVPLPHDGYDTPVRWSDSKLKIKYKNVAHPKLAEFIKSQSWVMESGEYLTFPQNQSKLKGGIAHYLESIEERSLDRNCGS